MNASDTQLWAQVMRMSREGLEWRKAWLEVRKSGGRDLVKDEGEFQAIYGRFERHPLFAAHMLLTIKRNDLQKAVLEAMWGLDPADDSETDALLELMKSYEEGNLLALLEVLTTVAVKRPTLADSLRTTARNLYPRIFAAYDARTAAAAQLELPLEPVPERTSDVPGVPAEV